MTERLLANLDFEIFDRLLSGCLPSGSAFAITDAQGKPIDVRGNLDSARIADAVSVLETVAPPAAGSPRFECFPVGDGRVLLAATLMLPGNTEPLGALIVAADEPFPARDGADLKMLEAIASSVCNDLALNDELDHMANELTERYEELNLVYHTEDQVNYFAEGQDALKQLVENCCEYLDVGLAALIMREKGVTLISQNATEPVGDASFLVERLKDDIYGVIADTVQPLVINDVTAQQAYQVWRGVPYKLLACPVEDQSGGASGLIAIVNHYNRSNFSNGDKNLLSVMARKAAKIVQVNYDGLTGLMNREGFEFFVDKALQDTRFKEIQHTVIHLNIDKLHVVNDTISHEAGDEVIRKVARHLRTKIRDSDLVARLGGNDIGVLLQNCPVSRGADVAEKLREEVADLMIPWEDRFLNATASFGISPVEPSAETTTAVLAAAELACQAAKEGGKNRVQAYDYGDTQLIRRQHEMESVGRIQTALRDDQFVLYGQLIEALQGQNGWHMEVLIRLLDDEGKPVPPAEFLGAAERYHLMPEIDRWVVEKTLSLLESAGSLHSDGPLTTVSINLSGQSLGDSDFIAHLVQVLGETKVPLQCLCFEVTETAAVANLAKAEQLIKTVKSMGCRFSLDDFGSGLSSFGYLRALPVDYLKIDGAIVKEIETDEVSTSMVAAIHQIAEVMQLRTIAEFVENDAIRQKLTDMGVHYGQGFGIDRPAPLAGQLERFGPDKVASQ